MKTKLKAQIKKTGEIYDVDSVRLQDENFDAYELEEIELFQEVDWVALRNQAAIAAMQAFATRESSTVVLETKTAVRMADALIKELKQAYEE